MAVENYEVMSESTPQGYRVSYSKIFIRGLVFYYVSYVILLFVLFCAPTLMGVDKSCSKFHETTDLYVVFAMVTDMFTFCWYPFLVLMVVDIKSRETSSENIGPPVQTLIFEWDQLEDNDLSSPNVCKCKYTCGILILWYTLFLLLKQIAGGLIIFSSPVKCPEQPVSQVVFVIFVWSVQTYWVFYNLCVLAVGVSVIKRTDGQHWVECLKSFPGVVKKCFMEQVSEPIPV